MTPSLQFAFTGFKFTAAAGGLFTTTFYGFLRPRGLRRLNACAMDDARWIQSASIQQKRREENNSGTWQDKDRQVETQSRRLAHCRTRSEPFQTLVDRFFFAFSASEGLS